MWTNFNVNCVVRVKLTPEGMHMLRKEHGLVMGAQVVKHPFRPPAIDQDGWSTFQLWDLMNKLGWALSLGREIPFDPVIQFKTEDTNSA